MAGKSPLGGKAFDELARKLVQVPKTELDRAEARHQKKKLKPKRRKKA